MLWRHLRNSGGRPDRIGWILHRAARIILARRLRSVLERHAVVDDLYADYAAWLDRFDVLTDERRRAIAVTIAGFVAPPRITVLVPTFNGDRALLKATIDSVRRQLYPALELLVVDDASTRPEVHDYLGSLKGEPGIRVHFRDTNGGISACLNTGLQLAQGEYVAFLDHDDLLHPLALFRIAEAIDRHPYAALLYSDEDKLDTHGQRYAPHFKPDWNPEWIKTTNYILHLCVVRTSTARELRGFQSGFDGVQDWDLLLRLTEGVCSGAIVHVPHVLYHWRTGQGSTASGVYHKPRVEAAQLEVMHAMLRRRDIAARVERTNDGWWIRYSIPAPAPLVSVIIPSKDRADLLRICVRSLLDRTAYQHLEIVIVDHASSEPEATRLLAELRATPRVQVVAYSGPFNYSAECNLGVRHASGSIIVLLNNDIEIISAWWLDELVGQVLQPDMGIVGTMLLYPNYTIQHAGVIVGLNGTTDRPYLGYRRGHAGIAGRAQAAQDVTAVITACAALRRAVYDELGGLDEKLAVSHNDVDLCLRARERGYRTVFTPHAELIHHESASRGLEVTPAELTRAQGEAAIFASRWGHIVAADPAYNPNLTLVGQAYALAYPPRHQRPGLPAEPSDQSTTRGLQR